MLLYLPAVRHDRPRTTSPGRAAPSASAWPPRTPAWRGRRQRTSRIPALHWPAPRPLASLPVPARTPCQRGQHADEFGACAPRPRAARLRALRDSQQGRRRRGGAAARGSPPARTRQPGRQSTAVPSSEVTENTPAAAELLQELAQTYMGPESVFPPMGDLPPSYMP